MRLSSTKRRSLACRFEMCVVKGACRRKRGRGLFWSERRTREVLTDVENATRLAWRVSSWDRPMFSSATREAPRRVRSYLHGVVLGHGRRHGSAHFGHRDLFRGHLRACLTSRGFGPRFRSPPRGGRDGDGQSWLVSRTRAAPATSPRGTGARGSPRGGDPATAVAPDVASVAANISRVSCACECHARRVTRNSPDCNMWRWRLRARRRRLAPCDWPARENM